MPGGAGLGRFPQEEVGPLTGLPLEAALALCIFAGLFCGFAMGRRYGKREGFKEGLRYAPLEMRRLTWETGRCAVCGCEGCQSDVNFVCEAGKESETGA